MLFAFDLRREAILLVGGDKSGDWGGWYRQCSQHAPRTWGAPHTKGSDTQDTTAQAVAVADREPR